MTCHHCGNVGREVGTWHSPIRRIPWTVYQCDNPACRFKFRTMEGGTRRAQPRWMSPRQTNGGGT